MFRAKSFVYDNKKYNFQEAVRKIFNDFPRSLEDIHTIKLNRPQVIADDDTTTLLHNIFYSSPHYTAIRNIYYDFIRDYIFPLFSNEVSLMIQKDPDVSICVPASCENSPIRIRCDADYNHPAQEITFIIAVTEMWDTNSVFIESEPSKGDFADLKLFANEFHMFWGNKCRRYDKTNVSGQSRISMEFRVIPYSKYDATYSDKILHGGRALFVGDYFIVQDRCMS